MRAHIPALDGVRGVAVLAVVIGHATFVSGPASSLDHALYPVMRSGWVGVDLFFVLSGFLITGILVEARGSPNYFRAFYWRRILRIFPLYYAALVALFVAIPLLGVSLPRYGELSAMQGWYWAHATNILLAIRGEGALPLNTSHFWSLAVEEQFYFVWPFIVAWLAPARIKSVAIGMLALSPLVRTLALSVGVSPVFLYAMMPTHLDGLAVGALAAILWRDTLDRHQLAKQASLVGIAALAVIVLCYAVIGGLPPREALMQRVGLTALSVGFGSLVLLAATAGSGVERAMSAPALRWAGRYSYAIYVVHYPLLPVLDRVAAPTSWPLVAGSALPRQVVFVALVYAVSAIAAFASWHLLEKHFLRLRDRVPYRKRQLESTHLNATILSTVPIADPSDVPSRP